MFDLNKLGDMANVASEAKKMQARQEKFQMEQAELLRKISAQLSELIDLAKQKR